MIRSHFVVVLENFKKSKIILEEKKKKPKKSLKPKPKSITKRNETNQSKMFWIDHCSNLSHFLTTKLDRNSKRQLFGLKQDNKKTQFESDRWP